MIVVVFKYLIPKGFRGFTFFPFVFLSDGKDKLNDSLLNHERIHIRQQLELLVIPFFLWYGIEFLVRMIQYKNRREAYYNISFEREAYVKEKDLNYLKKRSFLSFLKYV
ncbi:hypothetical protein [Flavobacterium tibetense]|jgi:hypothetical protein|uniref:DUF4157 domain-containing protein n=1 Tax=Flavobacterium tibetense TaxID=2233533 RepID=A0A365P482_9FLAO|nr:hypothetical protein [Flavobacterium tibetense]RBA29408.1 hypothetical protein DPN68_01820 [Flavobacterium tibetense]